MTEPIAVEAPVRPVPRPVVVAPPSPAPRLADVPAAKSDPKPAEPAAAPPPPAGRSLLARVVALATRKQTAVGASALFSLVAGIAAGRPGRPEGARQAARAEGGPRPAAGVAAPADGNSCPGAEGPGQPQNVPVGA